MSKHIVKLSVKNVLAISAVEIEPSGNVVILGGKNGAGKSSVIKAIRAALGGKKHRPEELIHEGAEFAEVLLDLDTLIVEYRATAKTERIVVKSKDGARYEKPQAMLDKLFNAVTFDPLACSRMKPEEQAEQVRKLVGLDLSDIDAKHADVYAKRTRINREARDLQGVVATMPTHAGVPAEEVSSADLVTELERCEALAEAQQEERYGLEEAEQDIVRARESVANVKTQIADLEKQLAELRAALPKHEQDAAAQVEFCETIRAKVAAHVAPDIAGVRQRISEADAVNRKVRENQARVSKQEQVEVLKAGADALTARLAEIKAEREARIAAIEFPVPGLGVDDDGRLTLGGHLLSNASRAEQIRFWVAFGVAANPELKVFLIEDASVLDTDSMQQLSDLATEHKCHLWLEDARTTDPTAIIIEDGHVAGVDPVEHAS